MHRIYSAAGKLSTYLVVFNLQWLLYENENDSESKDDDAGEHNQEHTLRFIEFWLNSIARNAGHDAPVLLIGTHKDCIVGPDDLGKSNADLAASNVDIARAHKIVGDLVTSMSVFQSGMLSLHKPGSSNAISALLFDVDVVA